MVHISDLAFEIAYPIGLYLITFHEASIGLFSKRLEKYSKLDYNRGRRFLLIYSIFI